MEVKQYQGLILGLIIGIALFVFLYAETGSWVSLIMIPIGALMGAAPQYLRPADYADDDDDSASKTSSKSTKSSKSSKKK